METSLAKKPRVELQNAEEIIQELRQVNENQRARIQQLEEQLKISESSAKETKIKIVQIIENQKAIIQQLLEEQIKNLEAPATETKIKNVLVPELPNEIWLEIMSYLSTFDVLRNVARVSKRFHKLSEDPHVIRKIEVDSVQPWPKDKEEKYCNDFLGVLKRSLKLKSLSFGFSWDIDNDKSGEKFLEALPSMNHPFLQELCLKGDGKTNYENASKFLREFSKPLNQNILKYIKKCPDMKVLKFEFKPQSEGDEYGWYPNVEDMAEAFSSFELKNLQEIHLIGVDLDGRDKELLKKIKIDENFPKLQRLCLTCEDVDEWRIPNDEVCQAFASKRNIKLEISSVLRCGCGTQPPFPWKIKIYSPPPPKIVL